MTTWNELAHAWCSWALPAAWHATWFAVVALFCERVRGAKLAPAYRAVAWWLFFACFAVPENLVSPLASGARELATPQVLLSALSNDGAFELAPWIASTWIAGVAAALALLIRSHRRSRAELARNSEPAPRLAAELLERLAPNARVGLVATRALASPILVGLRRATIHVPVELCARPRELEFALRHELAHFARRDVWRALAVELCAALVWFHPLARVAVRRLAQARELACDAEVARELGGELDGYRAALARAALRRDAARVAAAHGFVGGSRVVERLRALERAPRIAPRWHALAAGLVFACACATLVPSRASAAHRWAASVLERAAAGERLSCFTVHAAALALGDELGTRPATSNPRN